MSFRPKEEPNSIGCIAYSQPATSLEIESLIKDLEDLKEEKTLVTKKELEAMKTKMYKLENENAKLKADLSSREADLAAKNADIVEKEEERLFYVENFHQNVKELSKMRAENKSLKKETKKPLTEHNRKHAVDKSKYKVFYRCELCHVYFDRRSKLSSHIEMWNH